MAPAWMSGVARCRILLSLWVLFCTMRAVLVVVVPWDGVFGSPRGKVALGCGVILCYPLIHCLDMVVCIDMNCYVLPFSEPQMATHNSSYQYKQPYQDSESVDNRE
jgi:hypothetical protein